MSSLVHKMPWFRTEGPDRGYTRGVGFFFGLCWMNLLKSGWSIGSPRRIRRCRPFSPHTFGRGWGQGSAAEGFATVEFPKHWSLPLPQVGLGALGVHQWGANWHDDWILFDVDGNVSRSAWSVEIAGYMTLCSMLFTSRSTDVKQEISDVSTWQALQICLLRCAFSDMYKDNIQFFLFTLFVRITESWGAATIACCCQTGYFLICYLYVFNHGGCVRRTAILNRRILNVSLEIGPMMSMPFSALPWVGEGHGALCLDAFVTPLAATGSCLPHTPPLFLEGVWTKLFVGPAAETLLLSCSW